MKYYEFIPFAGDLKDLQGPELIALRDVAEGWFVDYKSAALTPKAFGKHLSAFANQHGGWLFIGVAEDPATMRAAEFPGVPSESVGELRVCLREASSAHTVPEVYFESKVIEGPVETLGLPAGRAILVVGVPEGVNTPHIHSSGRIYRRVADCSDPREETDQRVLELLWARRDGVRRRLKSFLTSVPTLSKAEGANAHAYVYLVADPSFRQGIWNIHYDDIVETMCSDDRSSATSVSFDSIFPTTDGVIARQTKGNNPLFENLTFRYWSNGDARITIPMNVTTQQDRQIRFHPLRLRLAELLEEKGFRNVRIVDLSIFAAATASVIVKYLRLRELAGVDGPFFGKVRLDHVWRLVPFLNIEHYIRDVERFGAPLIQDDEVLCPPEHSSESLLRLGSLTTPPDSKPFEGMSTAFPLILATLRGAGISMRFLCPTGTEVDADAALALWQAFIEAVQPFVKTANALDSTVARTASN